MPPTTTTRPAAAPDRELTHPLDRLKGVIRRFVAYDTVLFVALFLSLWFWAGLGIDYGLFKLTGVDIAQQLTPSLRMGITITLAVTLVALVVWRVTVLVNKRFDLGSLALILEKRHPKLLGDRLITAIQMYDVEEASKQGYSADLVRNTIGEARERMKQVNVRGVFNWGRLWLKGGLIAGVWVLGVATALALYAGLGGGSDLARGVKKTIDVSAIFLERNALFVPTPWPRRAHLEVIDFDDEGHPNEIRVGKGMPTPPKVTARAVKWVVADDPRWNPDGWRAMTIADLGSFGIAASKPVGFEGDFNNLRVDDLERAYPPAEGDPTFTALAAAADDLNNSRKLRMLEVPAVLKMRVDGVQTRSRNLLDLLPDAAGQYAAEVPNLTETVRFTLAAEDFITTRRQITLVPPPTLVDLSRDEFQPAYLHYAAPIPEMGGPADTLFTLRGRMVRLAPKKIGLSSDKAVFAVPVGTELHITAEADKDLKLVELRAIGPNPLVVPEFLRAEAKKRDPRRPRCDCRGGIRRHAHHPPCRGKRGPPRTRPRVGHRVAGGRGGVWRGETGRPPVHLEI